MNEWGDVGATVIKGVGIGIDGIVVTAVAIGIGIVVECVGIAVCRVQGWQGVSEVSGDGAYVVAIVLGVAGFAHATPPQEGIIRETPKSTQPSPKAEL